MSRKCNVFFNGHWKSSIATRYDAVSSKNEFFTNKRYIKTSRITPIESLLAEKGHFLYRSLDFDVFELCKSVVIYNGLVA